MQKTFQTAVNKKAEDVFLLLFSFSARTVITI